MNTEELNELAKTIAANLDLSKFKGDIVLHKEVETEIGNVEPGGVGVQHNHYYGTQPTEETNPTTDEPISNEPEVLSTDEITPGTKEQHIQCFTEAMLKVQNTKSDDKYKCIINNTYDWAAVERLGKDIGLLKNYEELEAILKSNERFLYVPKNTQNLTPYRACIHPRFQYPNWQHSGEKDEGIFRRFQELADRVYKIYTLACKREHIKPYGSQ